MYVLAHNSSGIWAGGEMSVTRLLAGLQRRGHRVQMVCRSEELAERARGEGVPAGALYIGGDLMLPHAARFARLLRAERPDAVLLATFKRVFLAGLGARLAGVQRVVLSSDVPRGYRYRLTERMLSDWGSRAAGRTLHRGRSC